MTSTTPDTSGRMPVPGDVISARYQWSDQPDGEPGKKIRPCLVVKVKPDGSSMIISPISTKPDWKAMDCLEIPQEDRPLAGLTDDKRSFIKLTEICRVDLPSMAIVPRTTEDGRLAWTTGKVSDKILRQAQEEVAHRVNDGSLKGRRIASDDAPRLEIAAVRKIQPADDRAARVSEAARRLAERRAAAASVAATPPRETEQVR